MFSDPYPPLLEIMFLTFLLGSNEKRLITTPGNISPISSILLHQLLRIYALSVSPPVIRNVYPLKASSHSETTSLRPSTIWGLIWGLSVSGAFSAVLLLMSIIIVLPSLQILRICSVFFLIPPHSSWKLLFTRNNSSLRRRDRSSVWSFLRPHRYSPR